MNILKKHIDKILIVICLLVFSLIALLILLDNVSSFDNFVYKYVTYYMNDNITTFFKVITFFGSVWCILIISLILVILSKKYRLYFVINPICSDVLNRILKLIFGRPRPNILRLITESGYSFPSGHGMMSIIYYGFIIYLIWQKDYKLKWKILLIIPLVLLILLVGISRIYLGVHYASDILAAFMIGIVYLIVLKKLQSSRL